MSIYSYFILIKLDNWIRCLIYLYLNNFSFRNDGIDYTQEKQRNEYAKQCLGENPPTLELLVVKGPKESVAHDDLASMLPNDTINIK